MVTNKPICGVSQNTTIKFIFSTCFFHRNRPKADLQSKYVATALDILIDAVRDTYKLGLHFQLRSPSEGFFFFFHFRELHQQENETSSYIKPDFAELCRVLSALWLVSYRPRRWTEAPLSHVLPKPLVWQRRSLSYWLSSPQCPIQSPFSGCVQRRVKEFKFISSVP